MVTTEQTIEQVWAELQNVPAYAERYQDAMIEREGDCALDSNLD